MMLLKRTLEMEKEQLLADSTLGEFGNQPQVSCHSLSPALVGNSELRILTRHNIR